MLHAQLPHQRSHSAFGEMGNSLRHAAQTLLGGQHLLAELSAVAAHYGGLIDSIERAGWDLDKLERVTHLFDPLARDLIAELIENHPDMSEVEQQSFLAPFMAALHQFSHMSSKEKAAFRSEYGRFTSLHARTIESFAAQEA